MPYSAKSERLTPLGLALLALGIAGLLGALAGMLYLAGDVITGSAPGLLFISSLALYSALLVVLARVAARRPACEEDRARDPLSCLPNRRALHEEIAQLARVHDEVAIALIDLDGFKAINDHFGHAVGDMLLKSCAALLRDTCGEEARCYRLGGDEFAVVMAGHAAGTILEGMCRILLERLGRPLRAGGHDIVVGASIGLARSRAGDRSASSELLRRADVAMYMSKRGGKMRCTWFSPAFDERRELVRGIEDDLRRSIESEEFGLVYQPLIDAGSGRIVAVEALLRWHRPDGREIGPTTFVPVAEETGLINQIGVWVLDRAMRDAGKWEGITLSVNISAAQLRNPEFPIKLGELLEQTGFPAERLELEITETCLVLDPVVAERSLAILRNFGVHISLDDFGTGYASIGFLRQFRFHKLKLDRSLINTAGCDDGSRAMIISSIAMARALNMEVTAEGVETREQADLVRSAGADHIQGWLFYRPVPASEIDRLYAVQFPKTAPNQLASPNTKDRVA